MSASTTSLCLRCRVLVGDRCELDGKHRVVDLATAEGARAFTDEIWSAPRLTMASTPEGRIATAGAIGVATIAAAVALGPLGLLAAPLAVGANLAARNLLRRPGAKPRGTPVYVHTSFSRRLRRTGALEGDDALTAPLSGRACLGYSFFFRCADSFGGSIMLAGGAHGGFSLRGDDGREIIAEPGRFRLDAGAGDPAREIAPAAAVDRLVSRFHPSLEVPFDRVDEICVRSGATVEAHGPVVAASFSYRSAGGQLRFARLPQLIVRG